MHLSILTKRHEDLIRTVGFMTGIRNFNTKL